MGLGGFGPGMPASLKAASALSSEGLVNSSAERTAPSDRLLRNGTRFRQRRTPDGPLPFSGLALLPKSGSA